MKSIKALDRRSFLRLASSAGMAVVVGGCLDLNDALPAHSNVPQPPPPFNPPIDSLPGRGWSKIPRVTTDFTGLCEGNRRVELGDMSVWSHPWPNGIDAAALIEVDDFCPVNLVSDGLDFGGDLSQNGTLKGFLIDQLLQLSPKAKINLFTITNMRQHPLANAPIAEDDRFLLSRQRSWVTDVNDLLSSFPGIQLGLHGYWHYNYANHSAQEFGQYPGMQAWNTMAKMHNEGLFAFPDLEPIFRAPGWVTTPEVLRYVADAGWLLVDSSLTPTFSASVPTCFVTPTGLTVVRAGPDFQRWIPELAAAGALIVGHFHFTAPNANSLGPENASGRRTALGFAKAIDSSPYRLAWFSYREAVMAAAFAATLDWDARLDGSTLVIDLSSPSLMSVVDGVSLAVTGAASHDIVVRNSETGDLVPCDRMPSARALEYVVLHPQS